MASSGTTEGTQVDEPRPLVAAYQGRAERKTVVDAALSWAAAVRKLDARRATLIRALEAARMAGVPSEVLSTVLSDAEGRALGQPLPIEVRNAAEG